MSRWRRRRRTQPTTYITAAPATITNSGNRPPNFKLSANIHFSLCPTHRLEKSFTHFKYVWLSAICLCVCLLPVSNRTVAWRMTYTHQTGTIADMTRIDTRFFSWYPNQCRELGSLNQIMRNKWVELNSLKHQHKRIVGDFNGQMREFFVVK